MNRLDPRLDARLLSRVLEPAVLSYWSADGFALAQSLARAPLSVTGGFAATRLTLGLSSGAAQTPEIMVPLRIDDHLADLALSPSALDWLVGLLGRGQAPQAGRTLSFDAVEALLAGLLAPIGFDGLGRARLASDQDRLNATHPITVLHGEDAVEMAVLGPDAALAAVHARVSSKTDRLVAAPLSYLRAPKLIAPAVSVETLYGLVTLSNEERAALEAGGGVRLDVYWPEGRTVIGRRFASDEDGWRVDACLADPGLCVRSGSALRGLDDQALSAAVDDDDLLALIEGEEVVATGHLASLTDDGKPQPIFVLDRLADPFAPSV